MQEESTCIIGAKWASELKGKIGRFIKHKSKTKWQEKSQGRAVGKVVYFPTS